MGMMAGSAPALATLPTGHPMPGQQAWEAGNTDKQHKQNLNSSGAKPNALLHQILCSLLLSGFAGKHTFFHPFAKHFFMSACLRRWKILSLSPSVSSFLSHSPSFSPPHALLLSNSANPLRWWTFPVCDVYVCVCVCVLLQEWEWGEANGFAHAAERQLPCERRPQGKGKTNPTTPTHTHPHTHTRTRTCTGIFCIAAIKHALKSRYQSVSQVISWNFSWCF